MGSFYFWEAMEQQKEMESYEIIPDHYFFILGIKKYAEQKKLNHFTRKFKRFIKDKLTNEYYPRKILVSEANEIIQRAEDVYEVKDTAFYTIRNMVDSVVCNPLFYDSKNMIVQYRFDRNHLKHRFCNTYCESVANNLVQQAAFIIKNFSLCKNIQEKWNIYENELSMTEKIDRQLEMGKRKEQAKQGLVLPPIKSKPARRTSIF